MLNVRTDDNPADILTRKSLRPEVVGRHLKRMKCSTGSGSATTAPRLQAIEEADHLEQIGHAWRRRHNKLRSGGPKAGSESGDFRVTKGKFQDGENFEIEDQWKTRDDPRRRLRPWTGATSFHWNSQLC